MAILKGYLFVDSDLKALRESSGRPPSPNRKWRTNRTKAGLVAFLASHNEHYVNYAEILSRACSTPPLPTKKGPGPLKSGPGLVGRNCDAFLMKETLTADGRLHHCH